jgi:hypothetical protein
MKVKAKIFQIIKWEEKEQFFFQTDFGEEQVDLLHLSPIDDDKIRWYDRIKILFPLFILSKEKRWKYKNLLFTQEIFDKKGYYTSSGLPMLVPRPNNFKVGDIVEIDYAIKKYSKTEKEVKNEQENNNISNPIVSDSLS